MSALPNIVLVHGAWADGSSWSAVIEHLQADGYRVTAPQFPMTRLADDVARLRQVLARQNGPTVVAGHSYGGQRRCCVLATDGMPKLLRQPRDQITRPSTWNATASRRFAGSSTASS